MRRLTVSKLLQGGFREIGCWTLEGDAIIVPNGLPKERGVYAFVLGDAAIYVGLASQSLSKRLAFYARPSFSQATNLRINKLIGERSREGQPIRIFCAHPTDQAWNGWRISGPQGLEAALIDDFDLEWNVRGSRSLPVKKVLIAAEKNMSSNSHKGRERRTGVRARILDQIRRRPGMTELELAKAIYGLSALQPQANPHCRALVADKLIERRGRGGRNDPFVYFPKNIAR